MAAGPSSATSPNSAPTSMRGPPKILHAPGHSFSDVARKVVSIINLDSLAALADVVRAPVDPLRFRANVYVAGWPVWSELDLLGKVLAVGPCTRLKVVKRAGLRIDVGRRAAHNAISTQQRLRHIEVAESSDLRVHAAEESESLAARIVRGLLRHFAHCRRRLSQ
jgi:uncharacterized protein YcbX